MDLLTQARNRYAALQRGMLTMQQEINRLQNDLVATEGAAQECKFWIDTIERDLKEIEKAVDEGVAEAPANVG